jgi:sterol desaturase/sphingolipid hydroxylase (fatty acid hydroxylase superfamily)
MRVLHPLYGGGFFVAFAQVATVYYTTAAFLHWIVPIWFPVSSVQKSATPRPGQAAREALNSVAPLVVKAIVLTIVEKLHGAGYTLQYDSNDNNSNNSDSSSVSSSSSSNSTDSNSSSIDRTNTTALILYHPLYWLLTIVILDILHDSWFYWTHRFLHWKPIYTNIHIIHHHSVAPTPFAGYSFHILEAALVFLNEILVTFLFPIHAGLHRLYHILTTLIHIGGHAGYEIAPFIPSMEAVLMMWQSKDVRQRVLNTVRHHDMHHRWPTVHFSLYFCHWDRWMGTEHPKYREELDVGR